MFIDAVQQLMSYSTWKDTKVSLMIFNKENKNFKAILEKNRRLGRNEYQLLQKE